MKAVIYVRISLDITGEGLGVARQEEACRELCERRGWEVTQVVRDNSVSATKGHRPGWATVLGLIEGRQVDVVVAWQVDRMYRQPRELEDLVDLSDRYGVLLATVQGDIDLTTPNGKLIARITGATARQEIEMKSARQKAGYKQRAQSGTQWWTARPYGYEMSGELRQKEAEDLVLSYRDVLAGLSLSAIARRRNETGLLTSYGKRWTPTTVRTNLLAPRNVAVRTHRGVEVGPGNWEPVIDLPTWEAVRALLTAPGRHRGGNGGRLALLTGVASCGRCGAGFRLGWKKPGRDHGGEPIYVCINACTSHPLRKVDTWVAAHVLARLRQPEWLRHAARQGENVAPLIERRETLVATANQLARERGAGELDAAEYRVMKEGNAAAMRELDEQIDRVLDSTRAAMLDPEGIIEKWDAMSTDEKRLVVEATVEVVLNPRKQGTRTWDGTRDCAVTFVGAETG